MRPELRKPIGEFTASAHEGLADTIKPRARMRVGNHDRRLFLLHEFQAAKCNSMFNNIGMIAGMKGMAIGEHGLVFHGNGVEAAPKKPARNCAVGPPGVGNAFCLDAILLVQALNGLKQPEVGSGKDIGASQAKH